MFFFSFVFEQTLKRRWGAEKNEGEVAAIIDLKGEGDTIRGG